MKKRIAVIKGHPDDSGDHLCHALAEAYIHGAIDGGHDVRAIDIGKLEIPLIRNKREWETSAVPPQLLDVQHDLLWAEHWALFYPLWLGGLPARLKGFFEQILRPGLSFVETDSGEMWDKLLIGRSARIVVTMATPALVYKVFYRAHTVKSLERNILKFCGFHPVQTTLIGDVYKKSDQQIARSINQMGELGVKAI